MLYSSYEFWRKQKKKMHKETTNSILYGVDRAHYFLIHEKFMGNQQKKRVKYVCVGEQ